MKVRLPFVCLAILLVTACQSVLPIQLQEDEPTFTGTLRVGKYAFVPEGTHLPESNKEILHERSLAFMEKYPGVSIEFVDADLNKNYKSLLEDPNRTPDIIELTVNEARLSARDLIENLTGQIEDSVSEWEGEYRKIIEMSEIEGENYMLPIFSDPVFVYYQPDIFKSNHIPVPKDGWTYGEYVDISRQLVAKGYRVEHADTLNELEPFIQTLGGTFAAPEMQDISGHFDSEATAAAFVNFSGMLRETEPSREDTEAALSVKRTANATSGILQANYAVAPLPSTVEGTNYNTSLMTGFAITKSSMQKELAWEYMKFLLGSSSEEAMNFLTNHTLEKIQIHNRIGHKPIFEEVKAWIRHEVTNAKPATFNLIWYDGLYSENAVPQRTQQQLKTFSDTETVKRELKLWADEIKMRAPLLSETPEEAENR